MRVLITTIGHQDPLSDHTVDYRGSASQQRRELEKLLVKFQQGVSSDDLPEGVREGPILSALRSMANEDRPFVSLPDDPADPWVPDEIWLVHQPEPEIHDGMGLELGPIKARVRLLKACFGRLPRYRTFQNVVVREFHLKASVYDYVACWKAVEKNFLTVLNSQTGETPDVRILFGSGPNSLRVALFVLYCVLKPGVARLWHLFDRELAKSGDRAAYPLEFGPNGLPQLGDVAAFQDEIRSLRFRISQLEEQVRLGSAGSEPAGVRSGSAEEFRRQRAQVLVNDLIADPDAPIWNRPGKLVKSRLEAELSRRLAELGDPISKRTLPVWFANGLKPEGERGPLYLLPPPNPRRPA